VVVVDLSETAEEIDVGANPIALNRRLLLEALRSRKFKLLHIPRRKITSKIPRGIASRKFPKPRVPLIQLRQVLWLNLKNPRGGIKRRNNVGKRRCKIPLLRVSSVKPKESLSPAKKIVLSTHGRRNEQSLSP